MKRYEVTSNTLLSRRIPVILRVDGKAFHTFTRHFERPFDREFYRLMQATALFLVKEIQGAQLAYGQSDEISILITDYAKLNTEAWFGYKVQKMASVAASMATYAFNELYEGPGLPLFDARVFNLPQAEVTNYFVWRQKDATRNSLNSLAREHFSHQDLQGEHLDNIHDRLHDIGINWNDLPTMYKRGWGVRKDQFVSDNRNPWIVDTQIPIFTQDRTYIEPLVYLEGT